MLIKMAKNFNEMDKDCQDMQEAMIKATNIKNEGDYAALVKILVELKELIKESKQRKTENLD